MKILKSFDDLKGKTIKSTTLEQYIPNYLAFATTDHEILVMNIIDGGEGEYDLNILDTEEQIFDEIDDYLCNFGLQKFLVDNNVLSIKELERYQHQENVKQHEKETELEYQQYLELKKKFENYK